MPQFTGIIDSTNAYDSNAVMPDSTLFRFDNFLMTTTDSVAASETVVGTFVTKHSNISIQPKIRNEHNKIESSSLLILSLVLVLIVLSKQLFPRRFNQLWQAMAGETKLNLMLREWNPSVSMPGIVFFFTYILLLSMILQIAVQKYLITNPLNLPTYFYWQILAITSAVILFRLGIKKFVAQLFKAHEINTRYNANEFSFYLIASLILFVSLLIIIFQQGRMSFYIGVAAFTIVLTYNLLRNLFIGLSTGRFSVLYLFLYLCALEIVPFLLLLKTISLLASGQFSLY